MKNKMTIQEMAEELDIPFQPMSADLRSIGHRIDDGFSSIADRILSLVRGYRSYRGPRKKR